MTEAVMGFGNIGISGVVVTLIVVLLIFGPSKLPQLGEGIGKMLKGFKKELKSLEDEREADAAAKAEKALANQRAAEAEADAKSDEIDVTPKSAPKPGGDPSAVKVG